MANEISVDTDLVLQETVLRHQSFESFSNNRILVLSQTVRNLRKELAEIRAELEELRKATDPDLDETLDSVGSVHESEPLLMENNLFKEGKE